MVHIVGAGSGAVDLITLRGKKFLETADVVIYAGSLVNPELLQFCREDVQIFNSAAMTLDEVLAVIEEAESKSQMTVRLHTGDRRFIKTRNRIRCDAWSQFIFSCGLESQN